METIIINSLAFAGGKSPGILVEIVVFGLIGLSMIILGWLAQFYESWKNKKKPGEEQKNE